ncbi:MBL fold metallo-hydrolase [Anaeromyxobacter terrae]|uniref:MBL fold metallo-hydrolase n=1 Tax=Anaeromyxobacter terrae TaxID=2925406 RepID=UPI001F571164|nr:MBL fold metallo-hydrolase [Anaeromyxobacter sp. SG22]
MGRYEIATVVDAWFALDGGAMFGIVPRPLWEKKLAPDARNRIRLAARCLVAIDRDARRVILVDDGLGDKWDAKRSDIYGIDRSAGGLDAGLARLGLSREDVTDVLLTHLHFDHAGGTTRRGRDGRLELSFPRATYHLQRRSWLWAHAPSDRDAGSFLPDDFALLQHSNHLHLIDGDASPFPDVDLILSEGHTVGQQLPRFRGEGTHLVYCGDIIPTHAHLRPSWVMGYDLFPVTTVEEKKVLLAEVLEDEGVLVFEHDPLMAGCRLREEEGQPVFHEAVEL